MADQLVADPWTVLPRAPTTTPLLSPSAGFVGDIDAMALAVAVCAMGAGRSKTTDPIDHAVALELTVCVGDALVAGQPWLVAHHRGTLDPALHAQLAAALTVAADKPAILPRAVGLIAGTPATFTKF